MSSILVINHSKGKTSGKFSQDVSEQLDRLTYMEWCGLLHWFLVFLWNIQRNTETNQRFEWHQSWMLGVGRKRRKLTFLSEAWIIQTTESREHVNKSGNRYKHPLRLRKCGGCHKTTYFSMHTKGRALTTPIKDDNYKHFIRQNMKLLWVGLV